MTDLVEHTQDPTATMKKVNRLLRPGGGADVRFPDIRSVKSRYSQTLAKLTGREWLWMSCQIPQHMIGFTRCPGQRSRHARHADGLRPT
jgi:hypothetical protein